MSKILRSVMDDHYNICVTKVGMDDPLPMPAQVMLDEDNIYQIKYNDYPDERLVDILLSHEYGHIYYNHLRLDVNSYFNLIGDKIRKRGRYVTNEKCMMILNICEDIQINSTILTLSDIKYMEKNNLSPCTSDYFKVPPGLRFDKYFDDVIDYLIRESENGNSEKDKNELLDELIELLSKKTDLSKSCDGSGFSNEITPENIDEFESKNNKESKNIGINPFDEVNEYELTETGNEVNCNHRDCKSIGSDHIQSEIIKIDRNSLNSELKRILLKISNIGKLGKIDSMKVYNRKTRGNSNILYSSIKLKRNRNKPRITVVVDVSASMDRSIINDVLSQLSKLVGEFNPLSYVVTWDTDLCNKYRITGLPSSIRCGGGTNMASAISYCKNVLKSNKVIFVTDMGTNMSDFEYEWKKAGIELNLVLYDNNNSKRYSKYFRNIIEVQ